MLDEVQTEGSTEGSSASLSDFASSLAGHDDKPSSPAPTKTEVAPASKQVGESAVQAAQKEVAPSDNAPKSSAETLNTGKTGQSQDDNVPWHKDPRWIEWRSKEKDLTSAAERGNIWDTAMKQNPTFAKKVLEIIGQFTGGNANSETPKGTETIQPAATDQMSAQIEKIAEKLLTTTQFKKLQEKLDKLESVVPKVDSLDETDKKNKGTALANKYVTDYKEVLGDRKISEKYRAQIEGNIWNRTCQEAKADVDSFKYTQRFKEIAKEEIDKYFDFVNEVNSQYTSNALTKGFPKTGRGGSAPRPKPEQKTEKEELADFAKAIKNLPPRE